MMHRRRRRGVGGSEDQREHPAHPVEAEPSPANAATPAPAPRPSTEDMVRGSRRGVREVHMHRAGDRSEVSVVGHGARIEGTVTAAGSLRVEGEVIGAISAKGDVSLSRDGRVEADIKARSITLAGRVKGNLTAEGDVSLPDDSGLEGDIRGLNVTIGSVVRGDIVARAKVELGAHARVHGDITCRSLVITEGAVFQGRAMMDEKERAAV
jgi:cytoskeletal protein CcmA (bactofilin family)